MAAVLEQRVTNLEHLMAQLIQTVDQTSREMRMFREESQREMREFKDEMREFKDEMREFKDEMGEFKDEMGEFKDEMREFKNESQKEMREFREEMGRISRKMGTLAEDMVAPSIPHISRVVLDCQEITYSAVRVKLRNVQGELQEFDVLAVCGGYLLINETKSTLRPEHIKIFAQETLPTARDFFPEYSDKKVIGVIASLYVDDSLVRYGERQGLIVLGFGEYVMDILNSPGFKPKEF